MHDKQLYAQVKLRLGIPNEEPIFILRAQDKHSIPTLEMYRNLTASLPGDQRWLDELNGQINEFHAYQETQPDRVKDPD